MFSRQRKMLSAKMAAAVLILLTALTLGAPDALAHAKLLASIPADRAVLPQPPAAIELQFSERLQPTDLNTIVVTDRGGRRFDRSVIELSEQGAKMSAALETLAPGVYTVEWKALSADDHLMRGKFAFTVKAADTTIAAPTAAPPVTEPETLPADPPIAAENSRVTAENAPAPPAQGSGSTPLQSFVRWLTYLAMMTLFGGFAFLLLVVKPSLGAAKLSAAEKAQVSLEAEMRFFKVNLLSLSMILAAAVLSLVLQTATVLEIGWLEAASPASLYRVLRGTAFGTPWLLQVAAALLILTVVFLSRRNSRKSNTETQTRGADAGILAGLAISALLLATLSLTGHARAAQSDYRFAILSDWLHLLAAGIWVGGIFHFVLTLPKAIAKIPDFSRLVIFSRVIARFGGLAILATGLLLATGIYNSWIHLAGAGDLIATPYGITLLLKIILFLLMLPLGGFNRFYIRPRIEKLASAEQAAGGRGAIRDFYFVIWLEAAFAAAILLLAAILAFLPHSQSHHAEKRENQEIVKKDFARRDFEKSAAKLRNALPAGALHKTGTIEK